MRPRIAVLSRYHDGTFRDVTVHPELAFTHHLFLL